MTLSPLTIDYLKEFISGDNGFLPKLSGSKIVRLFNNVGIRDIYREGMPEGLSRNAYVVKKMEEINGTKEIKTLLELIVSERQMALDPSKDLKIGIEELNKILQPDGIRYEFIMSEYKIVGADAPDEVEVEVHFEDIQKQILELIKSARYMIWVAVAWFTDKELMRALFFKKREGLSIRIIINDDEINGKISPRLEDHFEVKRVKPSGIYANIMHHKFCIIDMSIVVHGSYNWTTKAQFNKENISVDYSREVAEKYASQFIELIR